jgi:hypothetical protein
MKIWNGEMPLHTVSIKLDGVQAMLLNGQVVSRSKKVLNNIDPSLLEPDKKYEVYLGSFKKTNSVLRTINHKTKVKKEDLYEIWPETDSRLLLPLNCDIQTEFAKIIASGGEGLVIDQKYKLKNIVTYDVKVIEVIPGQGRNKNRMGALLTKMGKVGTGFTDAERELKWKIGDMIEVAAMEITENGKFRLPRFIRHRWDKDTNE